MSWTAPSGHVFVVGEIVTAATLNTYVKDNLLDLDRRTTALTSTVATAETTGSTAYTNLITVGPAVTVTTGSQAVVLLTCTTSENTAAANAWMSYAVSGATTTAPNDGLGLTAQNSTANIADARTVAILHTGLTPGSNTFTAKYRVTSGTGTFTQRKLIVLPLGSA